MVAGVRSHDRAYVTLPAALGAGGRGAVTFLQWRIHFLLESNRGMHWEVSDLTAAKPIRIVLKLRTTFTAAFQMLVAAAVSVTRHALLLQKEWGCVGWEEHFLVLCGSVGFDFVGLLLPPLVLHSGKCRLGLPLEVFEAVTLWSGGDVIQPLDEGFLLVVQEFFDALVVLVKPVLVGFLFWPDS